MTPAMEMMVFLVTVSAMCLVCFVVGFYCGRVVVEKAAMPSVVKAESPGEYEDPWAEAMAGGEELKETVTK